MFNSRKLIGATSTPEVVPEAVDFDGANDKLSRTSDLIGNTDSKTFTRSFWCYPSLKGSEIWHIEYGATGAFSEIFYSAGELLYVYMYDPAVTAFQLRFNTTTAGGTAIAANTWNHVLISIDMTDTAKRHVYINDVATGVTWTNYLNSLLNFTSTLHTIGAKNTTQYYKGRLAHYFLDYTYRDLSLEANRRLFIDADLKPADAQAALSPILYLPMTDAATAGDNSGTGGDFIINGDPQTSQRGPNQDNCAAILFDGVADGMSVANGTNISSKTFTFSFTLNPLSHSGIDVIFQVAESASIYLRVTYNGTHLLFFCFSPTFTTAFQFSLPLTIGINGHYAVSFDLSDVAKRFMFVDNIDRTSDVAWSIYINTTVAIAGTPEYSAGFDYGAANEFHGALGELYFHTAYNDLSVDNIFWNTDLDEPKPVSNVVADTGVTPLVALPLIGNNAGNNLGSIGDFGVTSGPFEGARGGSEFWARSIKLTSTTSRLTNTQVTTATAATGLTAAIAFKPEDATWDTSRLLDIGGSANFALLPISSEAIGVFVNSTLLSATGLTNLTDWMVILVSYNQVDLDLHTQDTLFTSSTETATVDLSGLVGIGDTNGGTYTNANMSLGMVYFADSYVDVSDPDIRALFIDNLGYPVDLQIGIDSGALPTPLIHMKFEDTASLGTNSGTGGVFAEVSTVVPSDNVGQALS